MCDEERGGDQVRTRVGVQVRVRIRATGTVTVIVMVRGDGYFLRLHTTVSIAGLAR